MPWPWNIFNSSKWAKLLYDWVKHFIIPYHRSSTQWRYKKLEKVELLMEVPGTFTGYLSCLQSPHGWVQEGPQKSLAKPRSCYLPKTMCLWQHQSNNGASSFTFQISCKQLLSEDLKPKDGSWKCSLQPSGPPLPGGHRSIQTGPDGSKATQDLNFCSYAKTRHSWNHPWV